MHLSGEVWDEYRSKGEWRTGLTMEFPLDFHKSLLSHTGFGVYTCVVIQLPGRVIAGIYSMWLMREFVSWVGPCWADWGPGSTFSRWNMSDPWQRQENWIILLSSIRKYTVAFIWIQSNKKLSCITGSSHATHAWMQPLCVWVESTLFHTEAHSPWASNHLHSVSFSNCLYKHCTTLALCCG